MKLTSIIHLLSFTTLAQSIPAQNVQTDTTTPSNTTRSSTLSPATSPYPNIARLGRAVVVNHCPFTIYLWSVGSTVRPQTTVLPYEQYSETLRKDRPGRGIAIKISTMHDGLYTGAPLMVFAYTLSEGHIWYNLSDDFGDPFQGHTVALRPAEPEIYWQNGVPPSGSQVRVRADSEDLVLTLC